MKKYGLIYGSATGNTRRIAQAIATELDIEKEDIYDVTAVSPDVLALYDTLILGTSTWGDGEVEDDWYDMLAGISAIDLSDKKIALFGCGDETMSETFCNGVGQLYKEFGKTGAKFIAPFNTTGYHYNHSSAINPVDGVAVGLLLDEVNHPELTEERIKDWVELIKNS